MCNGWRHRRGCNCGWGGVYYGSCGNLLSSQPRNVVACNTSSNLADKAKTFLTPCPWGCRDDIYYHTNGYGDSVYFDSLSYPWQVHQCFKNYWESRKALKSLEPRRDELRFYTYFFNMSAAQQKRLILIGAARKIPNVTVGAFLIYRATEDALAKQMGIPVEQLKEIYGLCYIEESSGIKIFTEMEIEARLRAKTLIVKPKTHSRISANHTQSVPISPIKKNQVRCPHCKQGVRNNRLKNHLKKKCKGK
jgi:hypothetical protein